MQTICRRKLGLAVISRNRRCLSTEDSRSEIERKRLEYEAKYSERLQRVAKESVISLNSIQQIS